jgi:class 3 adenylate cyclase
LQSLFKVDSALIYLADYEKNMLVPFADQGSARAGGLQSILVPADFWNKHACEPEKGVLNVISGRSSLPSLRQLIPGADLDAIAVMPLSADGRVIGLVAVIKQKAENKAYLDPELFVTFAYVLASALDNCSVHEMRINLLDSANRKAQQIEKSFGKYVSPTIVKELVDNENLAVLGGKKRNVSIMIVDLRGFTALTGVLRLEYLVQMLNCWFEEASSLILGNHGSIDIFMGDGIMVIFGAPLAKPDDTLRAVYSAFRLQDKFYLFQKNLEIPPGYTLGLGISITTGEAVVGNFGSSHRMEYTAIGEVVNLAARLEKFAGAGEIVLDHNTFSNIPADRFNYTVEKNIKVKGVADQTIYRLTEIIAG